jgi:hypothetical protein
MGASTAGIVYEFCFFEDGIRVDNLLDQYILRKKIEH